MFLPSMSSRNQFLGIMMFPCTCMLKLKICCRSLAMVQQRLTSRNQHLRNMPSGIIFFLWLQVRRQSRLSLKNKIFSLWLFSFRQAYRARSFVKCDARTPFFTSIDRLSSYTWLISLVTRLFSINSVLVISLDSYETYSSAISASRILICSFRQQCSATCSMVIRSFSSMISIFCRRSLKSTEMDVSGMTTSSPISFRMPMTFWEFQGRRWKSSQYMVMPSDHTSVWKVYFYCLSICGLMNCMVPEKVVVYWSLLWLLIILATPKSDILIPSSLMSMFFGFISRWIIFLAFRNLSAMTICAMNLFIIYSLKPSGWYSTKSYSVPLLQYSRNRNKEFWVFFASMYLRMQGWVIFRRRLIYWRRASAAIVDELVGIYLAGIYLTANIVSLLLSPGLQKPRQTLPIAPFPSICEQSI